MINDNVFAEEAAWEEEGNLGDFDINNVPNNWFGAASQEKQQPKNCGWGERFIRNVEIDLTILIDWTSLTHEMIVAKLRESLAFVVTEQYAEGFKPYAYAFHRFPRFAYLTNFYEEAHDILRPTNINLGDWFQGACSHAKKCNRLNQKSNGIFLKRVIRKLTPPFPTSIVGGKVRCIIALEVPSEFKIEVTNFMRVDKRLKHLVAVEHNVLGWVGVPYQDFMNWRNKRVRCTVEALSFSELPLHIAKQTITGFKVIEIERQMRSWEVFEDTEIDTPSLAIGNESNSRDGKKEEEERTDGEDDEDDDDLYGNGVFGLGVRQEVNDAIAFPPSYQNQRSSNEAFNWNPERINLNTSSPISLHYGRSPQH